MLEPLSTSLIRCDLTVLWGGKGRVKAGVWWRDSGGLLEPFQPLGRVEISKDHTLVRPPFFHITVIMNVNISTYIYILYIFYICNNNLFVKTTLPSLSLLLFTLCLCILSTFFFCAYMPIYVLFKTMHTCNTCNYVVWSYCIWSLLLYLCIMYTVRDWFP